MLLVLNYLAGASSAGAAAESAAAATESIAAAAESTTASIAESAAAARESTAAAASFAFSLQAKKDALRATATIKTNFFIFFVIKNSKTIIIDSNSMQNYNSFFKKQCFTTKKITKNENFNDFS
ncbi:MAG: hypothetical protein J6Y87_06710 [Muribaculaceae bacterium]|nr:hypothetical protein [Muribaculaceae bacterium]